MRPLNLRVILLLGGILLITLAFQIFQRHSIETFTTAAPAVTLCPPPISNQPSTGIPVVSGTPSVVSGAIPSVSGSGVSYYDIPIGNNQFIKLSIPAQPPTMVNTPVGPQPSTTPQIE